MMARQWKWGIDMRESDKRGMFWRWGRVIYRHRWIVVLVSVLLFAGLGFFAEKVPELLKDNGFSPRGSESDIGLTRLQDQLGIAPSMVSLVYTSGTLDLMGRKETQTILDSLTNLKKLPYVGAIKVNDAARLDKGKGIQSVLIELNLSRTNALDKYPEIRSRIHAPQGMKVYVDGGTATLYDIQRATKKDMAKSEMLGLPIALIVLLLIFGTVWAALLPLIVGVMSVTVTLGITYFIARIYSLSNFLPNMVTMLGLAVGSTMLYLLLAVSARS